MTTFLKKIIDDVCKELNINYKTISDEYIIILEKNGVRRYLNEYLFGLNNEVSGLLCKDKYAMYELLKENNIPVIEYKLIWHPGNNNDDFDNKLNELCNYFDKYHHLVMKDNLGSGGLNVYQIKDKKDIKNTFLKLLHDTKSIVVNPYYDIKKEYRLVYLNSICRLLFSKEPSNQGWQCNLSKGSITSKEISNDIKDKLLNIANNTNRVLQTKFVCIDIIEDYHNNFYVIEVNNHVTLAKYVEQHQEDYELVKNIYKDAILELFN